MDRQTQPIPITVYAEATPNPETLKFVVNKLLVRGLSFDFESLEKSSKSPLAQLVFESGFARRVFIANNFVSITKVEDKMWVELIPLYRKMLKEYLENGREVFSGDITEEDANYTSNDSDDEVVTKIKALLNQNIRPAVEMDGGAIDFNSYDNGVVSLTLKGACSGCPSSTVTLKAGIEALLKRMVPQVTEVVAYNG
ncbi:MAG: NifU family protein [Bacteroidetes bacterium]|jgi:Fe-S cluster biogenesis protein NfuA|nr:NifU family protein [Bacteroidota bacterium]